MEEQAGTPRTGCESMAQTIGRDIVTMLLVAAMSLGLFGITIALGGSSGPAFVFPIVGIIIFIRRSVHDQDAVTFFLTMSALCFGTGHPAGYVLGWIFGLFSAVGISQLWELARERKLCDTRHLLLFLPIQLAVCASVYAVAHFFPSWSYAWFAVGYLYLAIMFFFTPLALAMQASLEDDQ